MSTFSPRLWARGRLVRQRPVSDGNQNLLSSDRRKALILVVQDGCEFIGPGEPVSDK